MSDDNIIKFRKPTPEKVPKSMGPGTRKALAWLAVIALVLLIWVYFQFVAGPPAP